MNVRNVLLFIFVVFAFAFARDKPRIAVYVTGNVAEDEKTALGTVMLISLINSGRYMGIERTALFLAEIEREHIRQRSGAIDDRQISALGRQFGVKYVCIAAITPAFGSFQVSARIVDVETAMVVHIGQAFSPLRSARDLVRVADEVVNVMFKEQATPGPTVQQAQARREREELTRQAQARREREELARQAQARREREELARQAQARREREELARRAQARREKEMQKNQIGTSLLYADLNRAHIFDVEPYLRSGKSAHTCFYLGFRYSRSFWDVGYNISNIDGVEYHLAGFWEWHTNNKRYNAHGGPGLMVGYYYYDYTIFPVFVEQLVSGIPERGIGVALGAQGGSELRFDGWFLVGFHVRIAYYVRSLDNKARGNFAPYLGVAF